MLKHIPEESILGMDFMTLNEISIHTAEDMHEWERVSAIHRPERPRHSYSRALPTLHRNKLRHTLRNSLFCRRRRRDGTRTKAVRGAVISPATAHSHTHYESRGNATENSSGSLSWNLYSCYTSIITRRSTANDSTFRTWGNVNTPSTNATYHVITRI